jgi:hypothetical protein
VGGGASLLILTAGLWLGCVMLPSRARANDLDDFQSAVAAYEVHDYVNAVALLEALVGGDIPRLQSAALVLESRKYLAASYLFTNETAAAEQQFVRLLQQDPSYQIDPVGFPAEVEQAFSAVKIRWQRERAAAESEAARVEAQTRAQESDRLRADEARHTELQRLADTVRVERVSSRWLAALPFGVGQFQNGHADLGYVLAISELALATTSAVTWFAHALLEKEHDRIVAERDSSLPPKEIDRANFEVELARTVNRVSVVLLAAVIVAGVVDAQWRFRPTTATEVRRSRPTEAPTEVAVMVGPGAVTLRIDF